MLALFALLAPTGSAEQLPLKNYTTTDGLAHDRINRIVRDSRGFLWFCTGEGLSRFDGYQFKNYTRDQGLPHRSVNDLLETRDGQYWLATGNGLVLFNPQGTARHWSNATGRQETGEPMMFSLFRPDNLDSLVIQWEVNQLVEDDSGNIWIAAGNGVYKLERTERGWQWQRIDEALSAGAYREIAGILKDRSGAIWVATNSLYRFLPDGTVQELLGRNVSLLSLSEDHSGNVWAGSRGEGDGGLYQFTYEGLNQPKLVKRFAWEDGLPDIYWMFAVHQTADGHFWLGTGSSLAEIIDRQPGEAVRFRKLQRMPILSLGEDQGGNLWIGTESNGAYRLSLRGFKSFDTKDGLNSVRMSSIVNGTNGDVLALSGNYVARFNGEKFISILPLGAVVANWGWNQISFQDHVGEWWIAGNEGLQRYPKVERVDDLARTRPKKLYTVKDGLSANAIFRLYEDVRGDIWISTLGHPDSNLARWERATERIYRYSTRDGLPAWNSPTAFAEDHSGNLWVGFYSSGLVRYRHGRFQQFTEQDGLPDGLIREIFTDHSGKVWIATTDNGVVRIDDPDADHPELATLTTLDGLSSNQATCITEDRFGYLYIGTGRGINRLDPRSGRIKLFTEADGLPGNYIHLCKSDKSGALWFGSYRGLARFVPEPDAQSELPPIMIGGLRVNGDTVRRLSELGETIVENLELSADQRQIQIDFFALGFSTGENLRYQYKLDQEEWSELNAQRTVSLNLAPGSYRFSVRAINAEGRASPAPAVVLFSIARPLWQRWWFLGLATLVLGALTYTAYRYRLAKLLEVERVRTRIATDLHDDIGSNLSLIAMASEVAKQQAAAENPQMLDALTLVSRTSRQSVDAMSDIVWAVNPKRDRLHDLTERMRRFASDTFTAKDIEFEFVSPAAGQPDMRLGTEIRRHVYLIFKECVNNIAKHAGCTSARIELRTAYRNLLLEISDNGQGFDPKQSTNGYGGNGLRSMQERAAAINGTLEINARKGAGTVIKLKIPL